MIRLFIVVVAIFIYLNIFEMSVSAIGATKLTNIQCKTTDPSFFKFATCNLKVIKRGVIGVNIYIEVYKPPITYVQANLGLYKRASGYKPFLYNISVEYCRFARNPKSNMILGIVMNFITEYSNINHTCPFDHDIIVRELILPEEKFRLIPLPSGEYLLKFLLSDRQGLKLTVDAFFVRQE